MAFLMAVLLIHFMVNLFINKSGKEIKNADKNEVRDTKHPAEFLLR